MATKAAKSRGRKKGAAKRGRPAMPREVRAAYGEIRQGVRHLDRSIADLRQGLRRAETRIEADARKRIRALRTEARAQMKTLQARQREATRSLDRLGAAAGESWKEIKRSADSILGDARRTALAVGRRFRQALKG